MSGWGKALRVEYCEILEFMPEHSELVLRSGVGWGDELIGTTRINADEGHAGFTLQSNKAVILEDARTEQRFKLSPLLLDRDIISGICVIIQGRDMPFGILGVHTTQFRHFTKDYVIFLQNVANILSAAIERKQAEEGIRKLNEGLEQRVLERTIELETINKELQIMLDAFVGQELRMIELKERIAELEAEIGALKTS